MSLTKILTGRIPKFAIKDLGIADILVGMNVSINDLYDALGVAHSAAVHFGNGTLNASGDGENVEVEVENENNAFSLIGQAIQSVNVQDGLLGIIVNEQLLNVLGGILGLGLSSGLPSVNGNLELHLGTAYSKTENGETFYRMADGKIYYVSEEENVVYDEN